MRYDVPAGDRASAPRPCFETLAALSERMPRTSEDVFGALLAGACPPLSHTGWARRPLWNEEAMHRAYAMLQLLLRLCASRQANGPAWHADYVSARRLGADFRSLSATTESEPVGCSQVLRRIVRNLGSLLGPAAGDIELTTSVDDLLLPAYRRRALVLAASELVINALSHAFPGRARGRIDVCLRGVADDRVRLRVADDGMGGLEGRADAPDSVAGRLGSVLEGHLVYRRCPAWSTTPRLSFPVPYAPDAALREAPL